MIQGKHNTFTILPPPTSSHLPLHLISYFSLSPTSSHLPSMSSLSIPPAYHPTLLPSSHTLSSGPSSAYEHPSFLCTFPSRQYRFTHLGKPTSFPFNLLSETRRVRQDTSFTDIGRLALYAYFTSQIHCVLEAQVLGHELSHESRLWYFFRARNWCSFAM